MFGRSFRLMKEEESGGYRCGMLLSQRYLVQKLLGKGGFSEVYQAHCPGSQHVPPLHGFSAPFWTSRL